MWGGGAELSVRTLLGTQRRWVDCWSENTHLSSLGATEDCLQVFGLSFFKGYMKGLSLLVLYWISPAPCGAGLLWALAKVSWDFCTWAVSPSSVKWSGPGSALAHWETSLYQVQNLVKILFWQIVVMSVEVSHIYWPVIVWGSSFHEQVQRRCLSLLWTGFLFFVVVVLLN